jgi:hypothetical protein
MRIWSRPINARRNAVNNPLFLGFALLSTLRSMGPCGGSNGLPLSAAMGVLAKSRAQLRVLAGVAQEPCA